jgi:dTDP-4-dehydrorhamnose reductase
VKILVTGAKGMLGRTLMRTLPESLISSDSLFPANGSDSFGLSRSLEVIGCDIDDFDITCSESAGDFFNEIRPDVVVHCAAMTNVDSCESDVELAMKVNAVGSANIAINVNRLGGRLLAISTDYVFDGDLNRPYNESDKTDPATVYGKSKLSGEEAVRVHCPNHAILRIAWLYGKGGPSFYHTMVKLGALDGDPLKVVSDQVGNPTSVDSLIPVISHFIKHELVGTFHATCEGEATWFDFAVEIFRLNGLKRIIVPCSTDEFPRPAKRPANSRLDKMAFRLSNVTQMPHWKDALKSFVNQYPEG